MLENADKETEKNVGVQTRNTPSTGEDIVVVGPNESSKAEPIGLENGENNGNLVLEKDLATVREPVDFRGQDLRKHDLSNENLQSAILSGANLQGQRLPGKDLSWADLRNAQLQGVDLENAKLCNASLNGADLSHANLRQANFQGANLSAATLHKANLKGTDLRGANLAGANLPGIPRTTQLSFEPQTGKLQVKITRKDVTDESVKLILGPPVCKMDPMPVEVLVLNQEFDVEGNAVQTIKVSLDSDSSSVVFRLRSKSSNPMGIEVEFYQNANRRSRVELKTAGGDGDSAQTHGNMKLVPGDPSPDLTIRVECKNIGSNQSEYKYTLFKSLDCTVADSQREFTQITNNSAQDFLKETYACLNEMFPHAQNAPTETSQRLKGIGTWLYENLFPDGFKKLYWRELRDKVQNLLIISDEPLIPWELILPFDPEKREQNEKYLYVDDHGKQKEVDGFFSVKFRFARWIGTSSPRSAISLEWLGLIMDSRRFQLGQKERAEIEQILKEYGKRSWRIRSTAEKVLRVLEERWFNGLHFACHGEHNNVADYSTLYLEEGNLHPLDLIEKRLVFGRAHPLVFLNACETGQGGYTLTGIGGWAERFISWAKCSGFIGSIWQADDETAYKFAVAFYRYLLSGKPIGEAVRMARLAIRRDGDPTWLSYTLYAHPLAVVTDSEKSTDPS